MKALLFSLILLTGCSTIAPVSGTKRPSSGSFNSPSNTPLVAKFEPSIPPPPSATNSRSVASSDLSDADIDKLWVQVNNRRDSLIRSNPAHFWAWMKKNTPSDLKAVTAFTGQVTADAHYFNFGDVHADNKNGLALVDVDDSGVGSFYLDFVRYAVFVKAYLQASLKKEQQELTDFTTKELFNSYIEGLQQKHKQPPDLLAETINKSRADLLQEHQTWVQKKLKKDNKLDNKELGITGFKELEKRSPEKVRTGKELADLLEKNNKATKVYDTGYMVTDSGSSRGLDRFWFSLQSPEIGLSIYECKQLSQPATAYYTPQKNHQQRIADVLKIYSDVETKDSYVFTMQPGTPSASPPSESYWCRPKHFGFFKRELVEKNRSNTKMMLEYSSYLAYWMGYKQGYQSEGRRLLDVLTKGDKEIIDNTVKLITTYEEAVGFKDKK